MLNGKSAVVTGGASGIGEAIARKLADAGATVTIVIYIDLTGVVICNKWAVATILACRREVADPRTASVINMASILAHVGQANSNAYSAAKAAVANFTRSAALTYAREGIRFNAVSPGYVDTPLLAQLPEETRSQMISRQPIGRLLRPEEIANVVLFLSSDASSALTGSVINADGGYTSI
jgi:NAD(P)-dependent dehydrogenase (short-subunit alcohol dehydrogenase family)